MAHQMEATAATNASTQFIRSALLAAASLLMLAPTALFLPLTKRACGGGGGDGSVEAAEQPAVEPDVSVLACLWPDSCCFEPMPTCGLRREVFTCNVVLPACITVDLALTCADDCD